MNEPVRIGIATRGNMVDKNRLGILDLIYSLHPSDLTNFTVVIPDGESDNRDENLT